MSVFTYFSDYRRLALPPRFGVAESINGTADRLQNRCTLVNTPLQYCRGNSSETAGVKPEEGGEASSPGSVLAVAPLT